MGCMECDGDDEAEDDIHYWCDRELAGVRLEAEVIIRELLLLIGAAMGPTSELVTKRARKFLEDI